MYFAFFPSKHGTFLSIKQRLVLVMFLDRKKLEVPVIQISIQVSSSERPSLSTQSKVVMTPCQITQIVFAVFITNYILFPSEYKHPQGRDLASSLPSNYLDIT